MKLQTWLDAKALPVRSLTPVVIVAVYVVEYSSGLPGVKIAVSPLFIIEPGTSPSGPLSLNDETLIVSVDIFSLKVTDTAPIGVIPVAFVTGVTDSTVGAVVSTNSAVEKLQVYGALMGMPPMSSMPAATVTVYDMPY